MATVANATTTIHHSASTPRDARAQTEEGGAGPLSDRSATEERTFGGAPPLPVTSRVIGGSHKRPSQGPVRPPQHSSEEVAVARPRHVDVKRSEVGKPRSGSPGALGREVSLSTWPLQVDSAGAPSSGLGGPEWNPPQPTPSHPTANRRGEANQLPPLRCAPGCPRKRRPADPQHGPLPGQRGARHCLRSWVSSG